MRAELFPTHKDYARFEVCHPTRSPGYEDFFMAADVGSSAGLQFGTDVMVRSGFSRSQLYMRNVPKLLRLVRPCVPSVSPLVRSDSTLTWHRSTPSCCSNFRFLFPSVLFPPRCWIQSHLRSWRTPNPGAGVVYSKLGAFTYQSSEVESRYLWGVLNLGCLKNMNHFTWWS